MTILAEFRPLIGSTIPKILELFKNGEWRVVDALLELSEQGKTSNYRMLLC